jgi:peroxiredoxin
MPAKRRHSLKGRREAARLFTRFIIAVPLVAALGVVVWLVAFAQPASERLLERFKVKPGSQVPYVQLQDREGRSTSLSQLSAGRPTLVLITDADCTHCDSQVRLLHALRNRGEPAPRMVGVSVSKPERFGALAAKFGGIPIYDDVNKALRDKLGLQGVPVMLSVAADGTVREVKFGLQNGSQLQAMAKGAIAPARLSGAPPPGR